MIAAEIPAVVAAALAVAASTAATAFASGAVAGLAIAVPVGAVSTIVVLLGARRGWRVGAAAGLGAASVDGLYATVALVAGAALAPVLEEHRGALRWTSAAVLVVVAVVLARPAWRPTTGSPLPVSGETGAAAGPRRVYLTVVGLTAVNPTTVVYFAALVAGPAAAAVRTVPQRAAFVLGTLMASAGWQLLLARAGASLGDLLAGRCWRRVTAAVGALAVVGLALRTALSG